MSTLRNAVLLRYPTETEIVWYKKPFYINGNPRKDVDRSKFYEFGQDGVYRIVKEGKNLSSLVTSLKKSAQRAVSNAYQIVRNSFWDFFFTFTIDPKKYGYSSIERKVYWKRFRDLLKFKFPELVIFCVPELHHGKKANVFFGMENGRSNENTLHFHALICLNGIDRDEFLRFATVLARPTKIVNSRRYKTIDGVLYTKKDNKPIYNCPRWQYGYSSAIEIDADMIGQGKVKNYLVKYFEKDFHNPRLGEHRYFVTHNAKRPERANAYIALDELTNSIFTQCMKVTQNCEIYHNFNGYFDFVFKKEQNNAEITPIRARRAIRRATHYKFNTYGWKVKKTVFGFPDMPSADLRLLTQILCNAKLTTGYDDGWESPTQLREHERFIMRKHFAKHKLCDCKGETIPDRVENPAGLKKTRLYDIEDVF